MNKFCLKIALFILVLTGFEVLSGSIATVSAQVSAMVDLSRKSVYVQQPFRVNITVYTKTWFTQPVEFTNLQIPNAFIIPFDRTQPGMFNVGGKQYPGVQFYYIVFPYKPGEFTVPSLEITAQSPPEGSSQSRKVVIHTQEQHYIVKDIPKEIKNKEAWFVAKNVQLKEHWKPDRQELKVGDVLKRTIIIDANGTLPQFIPDLSKQGQVNWAGIYPQTPDLKDTRNESDVNGRSTQTITYLLEKPGHFSVPVIELSYWNPNTGKTNRIATPALEIDVAKNPDLGILTTLKDSLNSTIPSGPDTAKKPSAFLIFGMKWYEFAGWIILGAVVVYFLYRIGRYGVRKIAAGRKKYHNSERYLFKKFLKSKNSPESVLPSMYQWWDNLKDKPSPSIYNSLEQQGKQDAANEVQDYLTQSYSGNLPGSNALKKTMERVRKHILKTIHTK